MRGVASGVMIGAVLAGAVVGPSATRAAPTAGDVAHAKDLYKSAEVAMTEARYADAIRDYGAAYEITKDPVLFYKIGTANERLGKCEVALIYYRRYLKEGKPSEQFARTTAERIVACGGSVEPDRGSAGSAGSADAGSGAGSAVDPGPGSAAPPDPGPGSASVPEPPDAAGSAAPPPVLGRHRGPWLLIGGSIAFATLGAVLAYSADAAEGDVSDLYVGIGGMPPIFDARTRKRFDDAVAEGERYQTLSLVSFGIAGAAAIGAAVWFLADQDREPAVTVTPTVTSQSGGVSATIRF